MLDYSAWIALVIRPIQGILVHSNNLYSMVLNMEKQGKTTERKNI